MVILFVLRPFSRIFIKKASFCNIPFRFFAIFYECTIASVNFKTVIHVSIFHCWLFSLWVFFPAGIFPCGYFSLWAFFLVDTFPCGLFLWAFLLWAFFQWAYFRSPGKPYVIDNSERLRRK